MIKTSHGLEWFHTGTASFDSATQTWSIHHTLVLAPHRLSAAQGLNLNEPNSAEGGSGNDTLWGSYGTDSLSGDDYLDGGEGNDLLFGQGGSDELHGGERDDWIGAGGMDDQVKTIDINSFFLKNLEILFDRNLNGRESAPPPLKVFSIAGFGI